MSESGNVQNPSSDPPPGFERPPLLPTIISSIQYMRASAEEEGKNLRGSDLGSVVLLPVSCLLLVVASWAFSSAEIRAVLFVLPLMAFFYYIGIRLGIVRSFSTRQAYVTWHILVATFLLGCTFTLFLAFVKEAILKNI